MTLGCLHNMRCWTRQKLTTNKCQSGPRPDVDDVNVKMSGWKPGQLSNTRHATLHTTGPPFQDLTSGWNDNDWNRVVRKQHRMAISPSTQVTCAIYFFVGSKKYLSIQSKHAKLMKYWQLYGKKTPKRRHIFTKFSGEEPPDPPSWSS